MKKSVILFLLLFFIYSCEKTDTPETDYYKMIGSVDFKLQRTHESGRILGTFNCSYYLGNTKVELLHNGKVVETTYTIADTSIDILYMLKKLELNTPYRIRIELNDVMADTSDEFIVTKEEIRYLPDTISSELTDQLDWFEPGEYYWNYNFNNIKDLSFDLYQDDYFMSVYPNPVLNYAIIVFLVTKTENITLDILDIKMNTITNIDNEIKSPGNYSIELNAEELEDGLYIIRYETGDSTYYCPFLVGLKGGPPLP